MTDDQAREVLAMKGALQLLEEVEEATQLARRIKRHAERLSQCASVGHESNSMLLSLLRDIDGMLASLQEGIAA